MKPIGIVRKVDELGRLVLPMELRRSLGIEPHTPIEIIPTDKGLFIHKHVPGCTFCGGLEDLVEFGGTPVCKKYAKAILGK